MAGTRALEGETLSEAQLFICLVGSLPTPPPPSQDCCCLSVVGLRQFRAQLSPWCQAWHSVGALRVSVGGDRQTRCRGAVDETRV